MRKKTVSKERNRSALALFPMIPVLHSRVLVNLILHRIAENGRDEAGHQVERLLNDEVKGDANRMNDIRHETYRKAPVPARGNQAGINPVRKILRHGGWKGI